MQTLARLGFFPDHLALDGMGVWGPLSPAVALPLVSPHVISQRSVTASPAPPSPPCPARSDVIGGGNAARGRDPGDAGRDVTTMTIDRLQPNSKYRCP